MASEELNWDCWDVAGPCELPTDKTTYFCGGAPMGDAAAALGTTRTATDGWDDDDWGNRRDDEERCDGCDGCDDKTKLRWASPNEGVVCKRGENEARGIVGNDCTITCDLCKRA